MGIKIEAAGKPRGKNTPARSALFSESERCHQNKMHSAFNETQVDKRLKRHCDGVHIHNSSRAFSKHPVVAPAGSAPRVGDPAVVRSDVTLGGESNQQTAQMKNRFD